MLKILSLSVIIIFVIHEFDIADTTTYRAAVLEHAVVFPDPWATSRDIAVSQMMVNLKIYEEKAHVAGKEGVDIMVFPEDGFYGYYIRNRLFIRHYLEPIPDPLHVFWVPCDEPMRFPQDDVQVFLSCLAKRNNMYIVANMGDIQRCIPGDPHCPSDGVYMYNTNVAYDRHGRFIAKYHKQNRFYEPQFNAPTYPEYSYFDTEFGRFGLVICNDIRFFDPVLELIRDHNVTDIAFPTAWPDSLPLYSSLGYVSSFAAGHTVNILAAGLRVPSAQLHGSGMLTPVGAVKYVYDTVTPSSILLISDVPVNIRLVPNLPCDFNPLNFGAPEMMALVPNDFKSVISEAWFDFVIIRGLAGRITVCQRSFCCFLQYERSATGENYGLGVFSGIKTSKDPLYQQVCILAKCLTSAPQSCGQPVHSAVTHFANLHMKANFSSPFIQPQVILSDPFNKIALPPIGSFHYGTNGLTVIPITQPLIHATLFGRVYRKDCMTCYGQY